jgi:hypothetical protein
VPLSNGWFDVWILFRVAGGGPGWRVAGLFVLIDSALDSVLNAVIDSVLHWLHRPYPLQGCQRW